MREYRIELVAGQVDLRRTLQGICFLRNDPTCRVAPGNFERATLTPDGPGAIRATWKASSDGLVEVQAWGPGAAWLIERAAQLLGLDDDVSGFDPQDPVIRRVWSRHHGLRIGPTHTLWHDLAWLILQQRVATKSAAMHWRAMVRAWGKAAAGPIDLLVPPSADEVASKSYFEFHPFGIERQRADALRTAAREMARLDHLIESDSQAASIRLQHIRGIGPWTAGYIRAVTFGDPDAIVTGDFGMPSMVSWALAGEPRGDDVRMVELLEPFTGHRWRIVRLLMAAGLVAPRRGPLRRNLDIRSM